MCLALARREGEPEHAQRFGTLGQAQSGIDIYSRDEDGGYAADSLRLGKSDPHVESVQLEQAWIVPGASGIAATATPIPEASTIPDPLPTTTAEAAEWT